MKNKPLYLKIIIVASCLLVLALLVNLGLNIWINTKLPEIISEKNETPYHITYDQLDVSLLSRDIKASGIVIVPKASMNDTINKAGIYSKIESIEITDFSIWNVLFSDKIKAHSIAVNRPEVVLYKKNRKAVNNSKNIRNEVVEPFQKLIAVSNVNLNKGDFKIIYVNDNTPVLSVKNVTVQLDGILITEETLEQKIPFSYKSYAFDCDSLFFLTNQQYYIRANNVKTTNSGLELKNFSMVSEFNRKQFVNQLAKEKDLFTLKAEDINIKNMDWGFKDDQFFFYTTNIVLDKVYANIYRSKIPEDDLSKKKLYNKLLRDVPFPLKIDTLSVRNSLLEYEEEKTFEKGAGLLTFNKFNLTATNLQSGFLQKKMPDVKIKVDCRFMNTSPMKVDWSFNVMDKSDGFNIKGSILNFDTDQISVFSKPYINATTKGILDKVYFNFYGNDVNAKGDFALEYHDFKVKLYKKKKPEKESKIKSAIGNLFIKNDSNGELKETEVELKRIQEKSFYNFLWRCIAEGLVKILL
ncbi:hypothetical protein J2X31_000513 [Flavobacterium arsenatis]|uniref:DUF748 domain-containing protein n=1 Tax=Flavobacterium arsenatis TaxID=1484332 RepID=A0ABU1TKL8_9FLAO|nr:hypothetical protein [Flavobacterium arsenatis]MDR6966520.1 hypothetical protein [Flavobacterium arsenatis]